MEAEDAPPPPAPRARSRKIRPLPKDVVDRIAAGEVVQRPVSVVKVRSKNFPVVIGAPPHARSPERSQLPRRLFLVHVPPCLIDVPHLYFTASPS